MKTSDMMIFFSTHDEAAMKDDDWAELAKGLLKAELKRRNLGYRDLAEKLTALGIAENERNLANKISRGGFTAAFLLQCMAAIGVQNLRLDDLPKAVESA
jgi:hypothetical protein